MSNTAYGQTTLSKLDDAIALNFETRKIKQNDVTTVYITAHVWKGVTELTGSDLSNLGTLYWYTSTDVDGAWTVNPVYTGQTITVTPATAGVIYDCRLIGDGIIARNSITMDSILGIGGVKIGGRNLLRNSNDPADHVVSLADCYKKDDDGDLYLDIENNASWENGAWTKAMDPMPYAQSGNVYEEDREPYLFRASHSGGKVEECIVGGSIIWNQLEQGRTTSSTAYGITFSYSDGLWTLSGTCTQTNIAFRLSNNNKPIQTGHKILLTNTSSTFKVRLQGSIPSTSPSTPWERILEAQDGAINDIVLMGFNMNGVAVNENDSFGIHDLTLMFGPTIADYIYAQEQATAGAGVALAKAWAGIVNDYYPYDEGSIKSVTGLTAHRMTGFNQFVESNLNSLRGITQTDDGWDGTATNWHVSTNVEGWEKVTYLPNTAYCATVDLTTRESSNVRVHWEYTDGTSTMGTVIPANTRGKTTAVSNPSKTIKNCRLTYGSTGTGVVTVHNFCINISDQSKNGTYEPYKTSSYPLDASLTLRGILKLDGNNKLYYDGDEYPPSGDVKRRYYLGNLGTLNWTTRYTGTNNKTLSATVDPRYIRSATPGILAEKYIYQHSVSAASALSDPDNLDVGIYSYHNPSVTADPNTIYLVIGINETPEGSFIYELATPTTEQAEPYTALQTVYDGGTEEFITLEESGGSIPVGHNSKYIPTFEEDEIEISALFDAYAGTSSDGVVIHNTSQNKAFIAQNYMPLIDGQTYTLSYFARVNNEHMDEPVTSIVTLFDVAVNDANALLPVGDRVDPTSFEFTDTIEAALSTDSDGNPVPQTDEDGNPIRDDQGNIIYTYINEWRRYEHTFVYHAANIEGAEHGGGGDAIDYTSGGTNSHAISARLGIVGSGWIDYCAPQLEIGNVASDWDPAPEDAVDISNDLYDEIGRVDSNIRDINSRLSEDDLWRQQVDLDSAQIMDVLFSGSSYTFYDKNYTVYANTQDRSNVENALIIDSGGIGFFNGNPFVSETDPVTGETNWVLNPQIHEDQSFISVWGLDGTFDAEKINVKNLSANSIAGGTLIVGGRPEVDTTAGIIKVYGDSRDEKDHIATIDREGIKVFARDENGNVTSYVVMNAESGFSGYDPNQKDQDNNDLRIFWADRDEFHMRKAVVETEITINDKIRFIPITIRDQSNVIINDGVGIVAL